MARNPKSDPLESLLAGRSLQEPPRDVLHRAFSLKDRLPRAPESLGAWLVKLVFDSGLQPLPAGLRSAGSSERRLLFEAQDGSDTRQLDLRLRRESGGTVEVLGQCLPPWEAAVVGIRSGRTKREAAVDESGEFLLRGVPGKGARLTLTLDADGRQILTFEDIPLPEPGEPAR